MIHTWQLGELRLLSCQEMWTESSSLRTYDIYLYRDDDNVTRLLRTLHIRRYKYIGWLLGDPVC